ncbi:FHA domain-containing protein FhaB/FipA [Agilicoccus flavus]|uniref:FHA domain-containing protein FhaB/FipA n=1 Tax=Agilicoccus flavus TaxID=2775968 RepID=UPI001CF69DAC|nr:FHA domain-containing protein [Agilicoccus flavus]
MSELTLSAVRLGVLVLLWLFIFSIVGVLRSDLYGTRIVHRSARGRNTIRPTRSSPTRPRRGFSILAVVDGQMRGTTVPLREAGVLLGRNPECTLILDDDFASGRHARVYYDDKSWYVEDLGSTNGTHVNGERIDAPTPLTDGTQLRIGATVLELRR